MMYLYLVLFEASSFFFLGHIFLLFKHLNHKRVHEGTNGRTQLTM